MLCGYETYTIHFDAIGVCDNLYRVRKNVFLKFFPHVFWYHNEKGVIGYDFPRDIAKSWQHLFYYEKIHAQIEHDNRLISAALSSL